MKKSITILLLVGMLMCNLSNVVYSFNEPINESNSVSNYSEKISTSIDDEVSEIIDDQNINTVQPKVEFTNTFESIRLDSSDKLKYELNFNIVDSFDYIVVSFVSTQGITLESYKNIILELDF